MCEQACRREGLVLLQFSGALPMPGRPVTVPLQLHNLLLLAIQLTEPVGLELRKYLSQAMAFKQLGKPSGFHRQPQAWKRSSVTTFQKELVTK